MELSTETVKSISIPGRRLGAFLIDNLFLAFISFIFSYLIMWTAPTLEALRSEVFFILAGLYFIILNSNLVSYNTLGKYLLNLKVVDENGQKLQLLNAGSRFLLLYIPIFITFSATPIDFPDFFHIFSVSYTLITLYLLFFNKNNQLLHDVLLNSTVDAADSVQPNLSTTFSTTQYVICGVLMVASLLIWYQLIHRPPEMKLPQLISVENQIKQIPLVQDASIRIANDAANSNVTINVKIKERPPFNDDKQVRILRGEIVNIITAANIAPLAQIDITLSHENYYWLLNSTYTNHAIYSPK